MKVTIEIDSKSELEKLTALFKAFKINTVNVISSEHVIQVTKGDKKIDPNALFSLWADKPRTLEEIRKVAWKRN